MIDNLASVSRVENLKTALLPVDIFLREDYLKKISKLSEEIKAELESLEQTTPSVPTKKPKLNPTPAAPTTSAGQALTAGKKPPLLLRDSSKFSSFCSERPNTYFFQFRRRSK